MAPTRQTMRSTMAMPLMAWTNSCTIFQYWRDFRNGQIKFRYNFRIYNKGSRTKIASLHFRYSIPIPSLPPSLSNCALHPSPQPDGRCTRTLARNRFVQCSERGPRHLCPHKTCNLAPLGMRPPSEWGHANGTPCRTCKSMELPVEWRRKQSSRLCAGPNAIAWAVHGLWGPVRWPDLSSAAGRRRGVDAVAPGCPWRAACWTAQQRLQSVSVLMSLATLFALKLRDTIALHEWWGGGGNLLHMTHMCGAMNTRIAIHWSV